jgi:3-hydroxy-9,10-secoandrosta-1,3,5(10)-triene-9,17-dione monooxygenase
MLDRPNTRGDLKAQALLEAAQALVPALRARAAQAESLRRCPDETIADFEASGLLAVCRPRPYGGQEMGYDALCAIIQTLARGCASQAWVYMVLADNPLKLANFSREAQADVWGADPRTRLGVAVSAVGRARRVEGGVLWRGLHGFCSGVDHADWIMCGGSIEDGGDKIGCMALIPKSDVELKDDWSTMGLAGTGSRSFEVKDAFVPDHRLILKSDYDSGAAPGCGLYPSPIYRMPRGGVSAGSYAAVAVGAAEGMLQAFYEFTGPRKSRGKSVADMPGAQMTAGLASAEIEAAERLYMGSLRETMETLERGESVTQEMQLAGKRNCCFAAQLAMQAASRLFNCAGGRALFLDSDLQRQFRDVYAASAHHSLSWDSAAMEYARHKFRLHA